MDQYGNEIPEIKEGRKVLFLFNQYEIEVEPLTIALSVDLDDVEIKVNGKETATIEEADELTEIGQFLPGSYEIEAEHKGEYATFEKTSSLTPADKDENVIENNISMGGKFISVYSNIDDAIL